MGAEILEGAAVKQTEVTAIHYRRLVKRPASLVLSAGSESSSNLANLFVPDALPNSHKNAPSLQIGAFLAGLAAFSLLITLAVAFYLVFTAPAPLTGGTNRSELGLRPSERARQQLQSDLSDSSLAADIALMRSCQKALTDQLEATNQKLKSAPRDRTLLKRKQLFQTLITNAGGTGVNDRLASIETAQRMVASGVVATERDEAAVHAATANLRNRAASWKTGTFANAGKFVGLHWAEGEGLTTRAPYTWGEGGWEADPALKTKTNECSK